jgi:filamentous hemagglutinin
LSLEKLPGADRAYVEFGKVRDYLLNAEHPQGASKAKFFAARGFVAKDWQVFASALVAQGRNNWVTRTTATEWGTRYQVDCQCPTPDGMNPCVRTVWEIAGDGGGPRLLTAPPI